MAWNIQSQALSAPSDWLMWAFRRARGRENTPVITFLLLWKLYLRVTNMAVPVQPIDGFYYDELSKVRVVEPDTAEQTQEAEGQV